jgi:NADPH:quinone reductase-like Zn-dependent oxidoreductase
MPTIDMLIEWLAAQESRGLARGKKIKDCDFILGPDGSGTVVARLEGDTVAAILTGDESLIVDWPVCHWTDVLSCAPEWHYRDEDIT